MKHYCTFSEAIREGAKLRPQAFEEYYIDGGSCAVGAAAEAMGFGEGCVAEAENTFAYMQAAGVDCPACKRINSLLGTCTHLNDVHKWTREHIADWLEAEEEKLGYITLIDEKEEAQERELVTV